MPGGNSKCKDILKKLNSYENYTDLVNDIYEIRAKELKPFYTDFGVYGDIGEVKENFDDAKNKLTEIWKDGQPSSFKDLEFCPNEGKVKIKSELIITLINTLKVQKSLFESKLKNFSDKKENKLPKEILDKLGELVEKEYNDTLKLKTEVSGDVIYLEKEKSMDEIIEHFKLSRQEVHSCINLLANNNGPFYMHTVLNPNELVFVGWDGFLHVPYTFDVCFTCKNKNHVLVFVNGNEHYIFKYEKHSVRDGNKKRVYFEFKLTESLPLENICFDNGNLEINKKEEN